MITITILGIDPYLVRQVSKNVMALYHLRLNNSPGVPTFD